MFKEALQKLTTEGNKRANALLGLSVVEWSDSRTDEALEILTENESLFKKITNHTIKGFYHNQMAMILRGLATDESHAEYFRQAITEYEKADHEFKLARNTVYRAHVKNNVGFLLFKLSRFRKAHEYLDQARRLTINVRDKVRTAQVNETRAQVFIAQGKYAEAEAAARSAVASFAKAGRQCLLSEALIAHGIALARLKQIERAQFAFQRAIEVAHEAGAINRAGIAALTLIKDQTSSWDAAKRTQTGQGMAFEDSKCGDRRKTKGGHKESCRGFNQHQRNLQCVRCALYKTTALGRRSVEV